MTPPGQHLIDWLSAKGAASVHHSGRTLLDHLVGVYAVLSRAGHLEEVCHAGLFHSVYGTTVFKLAIVERDHRDEVRNLIGTRSEELVWLFGHVDRPRLLLEGADGLPQASLLKELALLSGRDQPLSTLRDLIVIEMANLIDQGVLWKRPLLGKLAIRENLVSPAGFTF